MKKILLIIALVAVLAFGVATMASADGGPHGGYTATTDACAGCHRAHTATGPNLLAATSTYDLCITCHGNTATGAQTNVIDGVYEATAGTNSGTPLLGGGFTNYNTKTVTSKHAPDGTSSDAWGNGVNRGVTAALTSALTCASCHDPHGTDGYRLLRWGPTLAADDYDSAAKSYTAEVWGNTKMSAFCANCHSSYHETAADVGNDTAAQTFAGTYTHRVDMVWNATAGTNVTTASFGTNNPETAGYDGTASSGDEIPLAGAGNDTAVCTSCHFPHGTSATATGYAASAGPTGNAGSSALLRLDERGVCQACHQK